MMLNQQPAPERGQRQRDVIAVPLPEHHIDQEPYEVHITFSNWAMRDTLIAVLQTGGAWLIDDVPVTVIRLLDPPYEVRHT